MKQIFVILFLVTATTLSAQTTGKSKKELVEYLKKNMPFTDVSNIPPGMANRIKDIEVSGTVMEVKISVAEKDIAGHESSYSNCYSFDLTKIEYAVSVSNLDVIALKAVNDDTSIYKIQKCRSIDSKKETEKLPLNVFQELYFMLPTNNKEKIAEVFNQLLAICASEVKRN